MADKEELFTVTVMLHGMTSVDIAELRGLIEEGDFEYNLKTAAEFR